MSKQFIAYSLHGSSTKAAGTAGAAVAMAKSGYLPNAVIGVSGGACLAVPFALGMYDECLKFSREVSLSDWFDKPITNGKGKPTSTAIIRALKSVWHSFTGKKAKDGAVYSLGIQNTEKGLIQIITPELFSEYKQGNYAPCYIVSVDWVQRKLVIRNAKGLTFAEYLQAVHNSATLPIATQGGRFNGGNLEFDGGIFTQNPAWWLLTKSIHKDEITDLVSIYVTPDNNELPNMEEPNNIGEAGMGCIELMSNRLYQWDDETEERICEQMDINRYEIRLPLVLETGAANKYNNSPQQLEYLQRMGSVEAQKSIDAICLKAKNKEQQLYQAVNHPKHYGGEQNTYEAIKVIEDWGCDFCIGNAMKYISRAGKKDSINQDLQKAIWYLKRAKGYQTKNGDENYTPQKVAQAWALSPLLSDALHHIYYGDTINAVTRINEHINDVL